MIDRETIDRIYAAANIVDIIGEYVTLKRKGVNYQACCPFHNEKTPSFVVSPSKGVYKCFGCGKGGNAVTFVMEHENMTYPEALKYVAKKYGIEVAEREQTPEEQRRNDDRESMMVVSSYAADYFVRSLHDTPEGRSVGIAYFRERGFSDATIHKFGLGYCPAAGDAFTRQARADGYKEQFLVGTGLTIKRETGGYYDRFCGRVMFPIHSIGGRVTAFGGRTMRTDKKVAKSLNSTESEIYHKSDVLYGLYHAKRAIVQQDCCILVEGYTDVIQMHQSGVENVVAPSGTSLTEGQIRLIGRFTRNVTVIYDGDSAGIHASLRGIDMILKEGMNVRVVLLPEPEAPDSFARSHTASELQEYIRANEQDFLEFKAKLLLQDAEGDPIRKAALIADMVQSVSVIPDPIQRSVYIKECARIMDIDENLLIAEVGRKRMASTGDREAEEFVRRQSARFRAEQTAQRPETVFAGQVTGGSSAEALERELTRYLLKYGHCSFDFKEGRNVVQYNVAEVIFGELDADGLEFQNRVFNEILRVYREQWCALGLGVEVPIHHFINHSDPEVCNVSVDILTSEDHYVPSELWRRKEVHVESDAEMLAVGVPKAVTLYKSKVIERMSRELREKLQDENLTDDEMQDIMQRLSNLNRGKVSIARKLHRLIL